MVELQSLGGSQGVTVEGAIYPHPDYEGRPWSQWGQGIATEDGRFFSAIGDHVGRDGNSYIYEYDPGSNELRMIGDILSSVDHESGSWGYGKVHGQIVEGSCGELYLSTYWGTSRNLEFGGSYSGDILFRLDPHSRTIEPLGVPVDRHGSASISSAPAAGLVYGEAIDPTTKGGADAREGRFFVYDTLTQQVVKDVPHGPLGYRNMIVDGDGRAYYSKSENTLSVYDPQSNSVTTHEHEMPGAWLRASTPPAPDGRVYGVTREPDQFFVMGPSGEIKDLGPARGYTTSMALSEDGKSFYYVPEAHGSSWRQNSPLVEVNGETGEQTVVVELNPIVEEGLGYTVGGTYNIAAGPDGRTIYIGVNASRLGDDSGFGEVILLVVRLP